MPNETCEDLSVRVVVGLELVCGSLFPLELASPDTRSQARKGLFLDYGRRLLCVDLEFCALLFIVAVLSPLLYIAAPVLHIDARWKILKTQAEGMDRSLLP